MKLTADFETLNVKGIDETYVWAWSVTEVKQKFKTTTGNTLEEFLDFCFKNYNTSTFYFHNLKFDGDFILNEILQKYQWVPKYEKGMKNVVTTLITDKLHWYSIKIYIAENKYITILDSLKILNYSVEQIAKDFNLTILKGSIDYVKYRPRIYKMTPEEEEYIQNDTKIMAMALYEMFKEGFTKMTVASEALKQYTLMIGGSTKFRQIFPELTTFIDGFCRESYKGAFVWVNPEFQGQIVSSGGVIDKNSMYPWIYGSGEFDLPYGKPVYFKGQYKEDTLYPLYIIKFRCEFELKEGMIPTVQLKHTSSFVDNEYLTDSHNEEVILTMTNVDLELFLKHYDTYNLEYIEGYKFKSSKTLFKKYCDKYIEQKIINKKNKNVVKTLIAKLMLNSLYGKFGTGIIGGLRMPTLQNGILKFEEDKSDKHRKPVYVPVASFITAYARREIISDSQKLYNRGVYLYSDTDSIHYILPEHETHEQFLKESGLHVDPYELGAWDLELEFNRGKYLRQKCYIEEYTKLITDKETNIRYFKTQNKVTVAGLPHTLHKYVNFDNFNYGLNIENLPLKASDKTKYTYKRVKGGVKLVEAKWEIKKVS